jgi:hypothetical protein
VSRVDCWTVRTLAFALAVLASLASAARADEDDGDFDEDGDFVGFRRWSIALAYNGHGTRIDDRSVTGWGPAFEVAIGRERWQYLVEAGFASAGMNEWTDSAYDARVDGRMLRGGIGARWLARQFRPDASGGIELYLVSAVGGHRFYFDTMRVSRPEISFGFGVQGRSFSRPRLAFRLEARVLVEGFTGGLGVVW